ncbi:hypothetical protein PHAVU_008G203000 [Phaseolus vulgaris]|uniref:Uncharacterized protein n=1 Tax=Phaseolus vulgaris TaxID=3885 RepID=V7B9G9_PHAVU|nr:hypothetical protein PHAVU_008G203000g [Phaseolus vulgaris]ESW13513.1 hypothetical protein PHAVU_008G203000g [Phaseolus vulgaris]
MHHLCLSGSMRLMSLQPCFSILLLILFLFKFSSSAAEGYAKSQSLANQPLPNLSHLHDKGGSRQNTGEAVLGEEKRIIYTGPNPLHNR